MEIYTRLTGTAPLMMHNEQLADPMNDYTRKIKAINDKGSKKMTDADLELRSRLEWEGGLYFDAQLGPFIPAYNLVKSVYTAGTTRRKGSLVERSVTNIDVRLPLLYEGPRTVDALYDAGFVDRRMVGVNRNRVQRSRPYFSHWSVEAAFLLDTELLNHEDFVSLLHLAGRAVGTCDGRRIGFGRFSVHIENVVKDDDNE